MGFWTNAARSEERRRNIERKSTDFKLIYGLHRLENGLKYLSEYKQQPICVIHKSF